MITFYDYLLEEESETSSINEDWKSYAKKALATGLVGASTLLGLNQTNTAKNIETPALVQNDTKLNNITPDMLMLKKYIKRNEGERLIPYKDTMGKWTVGVGFNLNRSNNPEDIIKVLKKVNINPNKFFNNNMLKVGKFTPLTVEESDNLTDYLIDEAKTIAINFVGEKTFSNLPLEFKFVLIDMAYNMGYNTLRSFGRFQSALVNNDLNAAIKSYSNSRMYKQIGDRAKRNVNMMKNAIPKSKKTSQPIKQLSIKHIPKDIAKPIIKPSKNVSKPINKVSNKSNKPPKPLPFNPPKKFRRG